MGTYHPPDGEDPIIAPEPVSFKISKVLPKIVNICSSYPQKLRAISPSYICMIKT